MESNPVVIGKCWAAIKDGVVLGVISMKVPRWVDFEAYKDRSKACLEILGDVKSGDLIREGAVFYFQRQLNGKSKKKGKESEKFRVEQLTTGEW